MRAVMVMYDSLNRHFLSPYHRGWIKTPNFDRLARHTATFDNFFVGSLPCIPARRELHTGRLNFLHRGWSPLEPFDESMPDILSRSGVYTHLVTDHCHYWEAGGANYHTRFTSFEHVRGQEGDAWTPVVKGFAGSKYDRRQDAANRAAMADEADHNHVRCFEKGRDFILQNIGEDNWYLQLEYFDPHEPYFVPERFKRLYTDAPTDTDWPPYRPAGPEDEEAIREYRVNYAALVSMCDEYLGKLLDLFDEHDMWKDTMLIVNTDHGYMLGEKGFVGKNYMPVYDELANTPFFVHHPAMPAPGQRRAGLAQTPDIAPTLLAFFGREKGQHMLGQDLAPVIADDTPVHDAILYGYHGMHINITDGAHTYMRAAHSPDNKPLYQYTLAPWHLREPMAIEELKQADTELCRDFAFCDHVPVMRIPVDERYDKKAYYRYSGHREYGTLLFDRRRDPGQSAALDDPAKEAELCKKMTALMQLNEAPREQYERLGLVPAQ